MGRRMLRTLGAGLMEVGRQGEISRKDQLEKLKQDNLMSIAEGRQGLMRERLDADKSYRSESLAATKSFRAEQLDAQRDATFEKRAQGMVAQVYGTKGMAPQEFELFNSIVKSGMPPKLAIEQMVEAGMYTPDTKPSITKIEKLYKGLEAQYGRTVGKSKDAPEFDLASVMTMYPALYSGLAGEAGVAGGERPPEAALVEGPGFIDEFVSGSSEPPAVEGEPRRMGREFGLMSAEGLGAVARGLYPEDSFVPSVVFPAYDAYNKYIGNPFARFMRGDPDAGERGAVEDKPYLDPQAMRGPVAPGTPAPPGALPYYPVRR